MSEQFPMLPFKLNPSAIRFPEATKAYTVSATCTNCAASTTGTMYLEELEPEGILLPVRDSGGLEQTLRTHHDLSRDGNDFIDGPCNTFLVELPAIGLIGIMNAASFGCSAIKTK